MRIYKFHTSSQTQVQGLAAELPGRTEVWATPVSAAVRVRSEYEENEQLATFGLNLCARVPHTGDGARPYLPLPHHQASREPLTHHKPRWTRCVCRRWLMCVLACGACGAGEEAALERAARASQHDAERVMLTGESSSLASSTRCVGPSCEAGTLLSSRLERRVHSRAPPLALNSDAMATRLGTRGLGRRSR